jgi:hypothetical protein
MPAGYEVEDGKGGRAWWDGKKLTPLDANGMQVSRSGKLSPQEQIQLKEARDGAESARDFARQANIFAGLNEKSGTGFVNKIPFVSEIRGALDPNIAQMDALTSRMAPAQRVPGSGTTSDRDLALYLKAVPNIDRPGPANAAIAKDMSATAVRRTARAAFLDRYAKTNGSLIGADKAFADFWADYSKKTRPASGASNAKRPPLDDIFK